MRQAASKPFALADGLQAMHYEVMPNTVGGWRCRSPVLPVCLTALAIDLGMRPFAQQLTIVCGFSATLYPATKG